jgi:hypothetical protein
MSVRRAASTAVLLLALMSCSGQEDPTVVTRADPADASSAPACPPSDADGDAMIDWVPFVTVDGLMFQRALSPAGTVDESRLGPTVATVTCTIGDSVRNPDFRSRDGDAAFLPAGTDLREVAGYRADFRLAAWEDGAWQVYEVENVPDADTGEDLLDLRDKVTAVHLVEGDRGEGILATVDEPDRVATIVQAVLTARVLPDTAKTWDRLGNEAPLFVRFDMSDGTAVQRVWHVKARVLGPRIEAPEILESALSPATS